MSEPQNVFKGDCTQMEGCDIDSPLSSVEVPICEYYLDCYQKAAGEAEKNKQSQQAAVYRFLQIITGFALRVDMPLAPFGPLWSGGGQRSLIPDDLTPDDIKVAGVLAKQTKFPALRARLYDVLWVLTKDHHAGAEAAACYIEATKALEVGGNSSYRVVLFKRGLYLATRFGRKKALFEDAAKALIEAVNKAKKDSNGQHCSQLMVVALQNGVGEVIEFATLASSLATESITRGDPYTAKEFWEIVAECYKRSGDKPAEKKARIAAGEACVVQAENRAQGKGASFMGAASLLAQAIETLRRAGASKERVEELRKRLSDWQQRSLSEFQTHSTETDISAWVRNAQEYVKSETFSDAVLKLAFGQPLSNPEKLKAEVTKLVNEAPLSYVFGGAIVDQRGRKIAFKESLLHLKGEALKHALEAECFYHASQFHWPLRVAAFIEPAQIQVLNDHNPTFEVNCSPKIRPVAKVESTGNESIEKNQTNPTQIQR